MDKIIVIGRVSLNEKSYIAGWNEITQKVYISEDIYVFNWRDTLKKAETEEIAKLQAKNYLTDFK
jgi:hypothetical protein